MTRHARTGMTQTSTEDGIDVFLDKSTGREVYKPKH
jgi:hypothetical protein